MMPPAPGRFSTTTCCPSARPSRCAVRRATVSVDPAAACGTMKVTARVGYVPCALAVRVPIPTTAGAPNNAEMVRLRNLST